ncbi:hypothetical protein HCN44_004829 [Aphidius gifuensis]|uniref:Uncharacterized protein n=1 Tax=Aphidius gifuensis TaxID=684658 RepID=A0A834XUT9_APHGI|nr:hypothetical protein HCN44_004829 [Aphidius gifuensis]
MNQIINNHPLNWSLPSTTSTDNNLNFSDHLAIIGEYDYESYSYCQNLFLNSSSEFVDCFAVIDTHDYAVACKSVRSISETWTLAIGYMQICGFYNTYLRIPDTCTSCPMMIDGTTVAEGTTPCPFCNIGTKQSQDDKIFKCQNFDCMIESYVDCKMINH